MDSPSNRSRSIEELVTTIVYLVLRISLYREGRQTMDSPSIHRVYRVRDPKISSDREGRQTMDSTLVHRVTSGRSYCSWRQLWPLPQI